jgi:chemotaxis protein methyltransferase CheR
MAIMLREEGLLNRAQIVASDLNRTVLAAALRGEYNTKNQEVNNKNYTAAGGSGNLSDYYSTVNGTVKFDSSLVSGVRFIHHDLTRESGPGKFDLILCRNVLIYFNAELQDKVIGSFSRSLDSGSFLAIGSKESLTWCKSCRHFEPLSTEENIYIKNREII